MPHADSGDYTWQEPGPHGGVEARMIYQKADGSSGIDSISIYPDAGLSLLPGRITINPAILPAIAAQQHEIWAHWMRYQFSVCVPNGDGSLTIPADKAYRWRRQVDTPYAQLSEREQASDIEQAQKILEAIARAYRL